jgi:hypothetical protein
MTFRLQRVTSRLFRTIFLNFGESTLWRRQAVLSFRKMLTFRSTQLPDTLIPWNCGQQVLWKIPCIYIKLHGITSEKSVQFRAERPQSSIYLTWVGTCRRMRCRRWKSLAYKQPRLSCRMQLAISFLCGISNISRMNVIVSSLLKKTGGGDQAKLAARECLTWREWWFLHRQVEFCLFGLIVVTNQMYR